MSARARQQLGPEFDHMTMSVAVPQQLDERYLVDVGTPGILQTPLRLEDGTIQRHGSHDIRLRMDASDTWHLERKGLDVWPGLVSPAGVSRVSSDWERIFQFTLEPRELDDFTKTLKYHSSPEGSLSQSHLAAIITRTRGRVLFTDQGTKARD
jgi:arylamine N-acetyltransferase